MLVLTRKQKQELQIGPDITITVLRIEGNRVRLGIKDPAETHIRRAELDARKPPEPAETAQ